MKANKISLRRRWFLFASILVSVAIVAVALGVAVSEDVTADSTASVDYAEPVGAQDYAAATPVQSATSRQKALIGALEDAGEPEDVPPEYVIDWQARSVGAQRLEAALLGRASDGSRVFAVPAKAGVCLAGDSYLFNICLENDAIANESTVQGVVCSPFQETSKLTVFGLLPSGVTEVSANFANGTTKKEIVENNFLEFSFPKAGPALSSVTWTGADGEKQVSEPLPKNAASVECASNMTPTEAAAAAKKSAVSPPTR